MDETGRTLVEHLYREFPDLPINPQDYDLPVMRYKAPFARIAKYDMRPDAVQLAVDYLIHQKQLPTHVAYQVAIAYIKAFERDFEIEDIAFVECSGHVENELLHEGAAWSKRIVDGLPDFCRNIIRGNVTIPERPSSWEQIQVSCEIDKGKRKTQEDRLVCLPSLELFSSELDKKEVSFFAIFDGHGGSGISAYAAAHIPFEFIAQLKKEDYNVEVSLQRAMYALNRRIAARCVVEAWNSVGSTAIVAAIDEKNAYIRWVGDSPAFVITATGAQKLIKEHNPKNDDEAKRVQDAGGDILFSQGELRVNGVLNISRALGDMFCRPVIIDESDGVTVERTSENYLLVLTSDGVSDMFSTAEVHRLVEAFVHENDVEDYPGMAQFIVRKALDSSSNDNCTCIVIFLQPPQELWNVMIKKDKLASNCASDIDAE